MRRMVRDFDAHFSFRANCEAAPEMSFNVNTGRELAVFRVKDCAGNQRHIIRKREPTQHRASPRERKRDEADREKNVEKFGKDKFQFSQSQIRSRTRVPLITESLG